MEPTFVTLAVIAALVVIGYHFTKISGYEAFFQELQAEFNRFKKDRDENYSRNMTHKQAIQYGESLQRQEYYDEIKAIAESIKREARDRRQDGCTNLELGDMIHEEVDSHQWVIYTSDNFMVLKYSDNDSYALDEGLVDLRNGTRDGNLWDVLAYGAMYADLLDELEGYDPNEPEFECAACGAEFPSEDDRDHHETCSDCPEWVCDNPDCSSNTVEIGHLIEPTCDAEFVGDDDPTVYLCHLPVGHSGDCDHTIVKS